MTQWLIRNKKGKVDGPLTTVEVIQKIRSGIYFGEELVSLYPSGRWYSISREQAFFDVILDLLEEDLLGKAPTKEDEKREITRKIQILKEENEKKDEETQKKRGQAVFEDIDAKTPIIIEMEKKEIQQKVGRAVASRKKLKKKKPVRKIKLKQDDVLRKKRHFSNRSFVLFIVISFVLIVYLLDQSDRNSIDKIHLRRPDFKKNRGFDKKAVSQGINLAIRAFRKDNFKNYLIAQDALIEVVERSNSLNAYAFLCMTYRELWPFSYQDGKDHSTLQMILRRVQKVNPKSSSANICLVVSHWTKGRYDEALRIMDNNLIQSPELIFFNQMTGDIYAARKDYQSAMYYFSKVRELWTPPPVWSKALLQEARMYRKLGVHGSAVKLYRKLLGENPSHAVAKIELGLLEFDPYQNISKAHDYIRSGLLSGQFIPKMVESEAYMVLAKIRILKGDNKKALQFAQRAFSINSSNQEARDLIVNLGGVKALNSVSIDNFNMVYLGEQYMKMKNFNGAQAEFRGAYEANPKNAFAALRAGEALWRLNQSNEAISWVKKSIHADPSFIRSYIILADYQSARFDYINAIETLKAALRVSLRHNGVFRGFALIELRRRNYPGAVRFAKKALELYDTDIKSLLILGEALNKQGNPEEAFQYVQQALELDSSNQRVHILFSYVLAALQGTDASIDYLNSLIGRYGKTDYIRALGNLLAREERNQEAKQYYFEALAENPKDKKALIALAKILQSEKSYDKARDYFLEAAILDPSDAEPLFLTGQLYLDSGRNDQALKQFERVIVVNPHFPLAHYFAGRAHLALGHLDEALDMSQKERLINPEIPEPFLLAAEVYYKKEEYNPCTEEYKMVLTKGLKIADVYIKMARCYRLLGNLDSALTMLNEAERLESGNFNIYKELGALYHIQGAYIKAVESYRKYLQLSPRAKDKIFIENQINAIKNATGNN